MRLRILLAATGAASFLLLGGLWAITPAPEPASDIAPDVRGVLKRNLKFTSEDLASLQRGEIVKRSLDTHAPGEVAVVAAVRVNASRAAFLERVRDIVAFKRSPSVLQIGRFSLMPALEDLAALTVEKDDFDVLSCRVGACPIRLSADSIRRLSTDVDLNAPEAQLRGAVWFKQVLLTNVRAYVSGGPGRMLQYDDGPTPIRPVDEFDGILANASSIGALMPALPNHLQHFPDGRAFTEDFLYWSKEKFGPSPFITVTHVTIGEPTASTSIVTTKDVYSSRYLDASLGLTIATESLGTRDAFYLVYGNRFRASALKRGWVTLRRSIVERRARGGLEDHLKSIKKALEQ